MIKRLLLTLILGISISGFSQCIDKKNFQNLADYILKHGFEQSSNVPPFPQTFHLSDEKHHIEFEHVQIYHPNKEPKKQKILIKKKDDVEYVYYLVKEGKKVYLEDHAHGKHGQDEYAKHFCALMAKMNL